MLFSSSCKFVGFDEAHFHLSGQVNRHNSIIWSDKNPQEIQERPLHSLRVTVWCGVTAEAVTPHHTVTRRERPLHSLRVTVWCGVTASTVLGPYFFESDGVTETVTSERYRKMIREFFISDLERQNIHNSIWFQT